MKLSNKKDKKEEQLEKLEGGFSLYTNGAHQPKERYIPRHTTAKSSSSSKRSQHFVPRMHKNNPLLDLKVLQEEQQLKQRASSAKSNVTTRKKWSNTSFTIKTTDGCEIKINAPNHFQSSNDKTNKKSDNSVHSNDCEYYYSDDFESDSDNEQIRVTKSESKNLIESVRFSDQSDREDSSSSDDDEPKTKPDRTRNKNQMVLQLSQNDIKVRIVKRVYKNFESN